MIDQLNPPMSVEEALKSITYPVQTEEKEEMPSVGIVLIPDLTDDQLRKLAREKLSQALQAIDPTNQPEMTRKLCAELMDRLDGKPGQSVTVDANIRTVTVNATIRFADEIHAPVDSNIIDHVDNTQAIENDKEK